MTDLKTLANDVYATISKHDLEGFLDYVADDVIEHEPPPVPEPLPGKAGVRQWFEVLFTAFPDVTMTPEDLIVEGDKGAARVRLQGTHRGDFMGIAATGKSIDVELIDIVRVNSDGKVAEHWGLVDDATMLQQLGAMPG